MAATATTTTTPPAPTSRADKTAGRVLLPSHVVPVRYDLDLKPDLEAFTFAGTCKIGFVIDAAQLSDENVHKITLHAKELCIVSASYVVDEQANTVVEASEIHVNIKATTVDLIFPTPIAAQAKTLTLTITYAGFLNNQMAGFYRSQYVDIHGVKQYMASTQFESLDARRCFPCVDEPARKAVFGVTLTIPATRTCFSNMPEAQVVSTPLHKTVSFLDTPKMSTYLLAFCVGEFDCVQALTLHGVLVKVYTPPGKASSGTFALSTACQALDAYDDFFGIAYPLPKLDMVAIPEFAMGAMENWGLVTYREVDLLIDPVTASPSQKQRVATVVTHELAHQWFGNLVTMAWWDDLWLNEGFASWAENYAADLIYPDYCMWHQFTTGHLSSALRLDALKSSHPIQVPIHHAEEVEQVFDAISYCKGGSVVRMIRAVLGLRHFQEGLANYMQKYAYSNTETFDLWNAWEGVSGVPIGELMASWTEQMGFPLVKVVKEHFSDDKAVLELEQVWFLSDGSELPAEEAQKLWTIPILTCTKDGPQTDMTLMRERTATVTVPIQSGGWVMINAGREVPMRLLPSSEMLSRLATAAKAKELSPIDRAALLSDVFALVKAGHMSPEALMQLLGSYNDEDEYIVWESITSILVGLDTILSDDEVMCANLKNFAKPLVLSLLEKIGWEEGDADGHLTSLLRSDMIGLLSEFAYDDASVAAEAKARFGAFLADANDVKSLPSGLRTAVFKIVLKNGGAAEYEQIKAYFFSATDNAERKHVLSALGAAPDPKLKLATMNWSISGDIKLQDFFYVMGSVGRSSKEGREIAWQFYQDNFGKLKSMLSSASASLMDAVIVMCAGSFCSHAKADEIEAFFASHPLSNSSRKITQTIENMRTNAHFLARIAASELAKDHFWTSL